MICVTEALVDEIPLQLVWNVSLPRVIFATSSFSESQPSCSLLFYFVQTTIFLEKDKSVCFEVID